MVAAAVKLGSPEVSWGPHPSLDAFDVGPPVQNFLDRLRDSNLQSFLSLSEQIRVWGQRWRRHDKKAEPLFGKDLWIPSEANRCLHFP